MIQRVMIRNYRMFEKFDLKLDPVLNVLIGDNGSGKSTLIEAINLALTRRLDGRAFDGELSPFHINHQASETFLNGLRDGTKSPPPKIVIELYFEKTKDTAELQGTNNLVGEDLCGIRLQASVSQDYLPEYQAFIAKPSDVTLVPTEYYKVEWLGFHGSAITSRSIPAAATVIDPTEIRLQTGTDYHLQQIIRTHLEPKERVELSRQYRSLRESFGNNQSVQDINERLRDADKTLTDRNLSLSIDLSRRFT